MPILLALTGLPGSGKDSLVDLVRDTFHRVAFADACYEEISEAFGCSEVELRRRDTKEKPSPLLTLSKCTDSRYLSVMTSHGYDLDECISPRTALRTWANLYRKPLFGEDYFVRIALDKIRSFRGENVCVTDLRFPNEYQALMDYCEEPSSEYRSVCVEIVRPGLPPKKLDPSDTALPVAEIRNFTIINREGLPNEMRSRLYEKLL